MGQEKPITREEDFGGRLFHLEAKIRVLAWEAKKYIVANWEKVQDWGDLKIHIRNGNTVHNSNKLKSLFYGPEDVTMGPQKRVYKKANPVTSVSDVCLDPTDGDFSITINGLEWWWISEDDVCALADYIKKKLQA